MEGGNRKCAHDTCKCTVGAGQQYATRNASSRRKVGSSSRRVDRDGSSRRAAAPVAAADTRRASTAERVESRGGARAEAPSRHFRQSAVRQRQPCALRHRRVELSQGADRRRRAAHGRRHHRDDRRLRASRRAGVAARRRHQSRGTVLQRGGRHRFLETHEPHRRDRSARKARAGRAGPRARRTARRGRSAPPHVRARIHRRTATTRWAG